MATLYIDVNNEMHLIISLRCLIPKMKSVVMEFCILGNKIKIASNGVHFSDEVILQLNANTSKINI